jgi:hypothetical protein
MAGGRLYCSPGLVIWFRAAADSRKRQLQRRARVMMVRSKVYAMDRDVHRCRQAIQAERQKLDSLVAEKQRIEQAR